MIDDLIDRRTGLDHDHGFARPRGRPNEFFHRLRGDNVFSFRFGGGEFLRHFGGAVEDGDRESFGFHVEDEVLAHDSEADEANITLRRDHFGYWYLTRMTALVCEVLLTEKALVSPDEIAGEETGAIVDFWGVVRRTEEQAEISG